MEISTGAERRWSASDDDHSGFLRTYPPNIGLNVEQLQQRLVIDRITAFRAVERYDSDTAVVVGPHGHGATDAFL